MVPGWLCQLRGPMHPIAPSKRVQADSPTHPTRPRPGDGDLNRPYDVALDANASQVFVAENVGNRISVFDLQGNFVKVRPAAGTLAAAEQCQYEVNAGVHGPVKGAAANGSTGGAGCAVQRRGRRHAKGPALLPAGQRWAGGEADQPARIEPRGRRMHERGTCARLRGSSCNPPPGALLRRRGLRAGRTTASSTTHKASVWMAMVECEPFFVLCLKADAAGACESPLP